MKNLLHRLNRFNREKITLFLGSLTLVLGARFPWYQLPLPALETFGTNLFWANAGRIIVALLAILGFVFIFRFSPSQAPRLPFWIGLIAALLFPYLITTWSPTVTFLATAYYDQGERVSHHVEINFPQVQSQWKQNILLATSSPVKSTFDFSIKDSRFFQMASWDWFLIEGLGYSNNFLGFIGRGWGFTVIGFVISLTGLYLGIKNDQLQVFITDVGKILPWLGIVMVMIIFSLVLPNIINHQLDTRFAKGQYEQVLTTSQTLEFWYPPVRGDQEFIKRMAEAGFYANKPDLGLIYFVKGLERYRLRDFIKAEDYFQKSLDLEPKRFLVRGYLATTILNRGINYLNQPNNRKPGTAVDLCEQVLRIFPGHVEALYDLMLASVVNNQFEKSVVAAQQIIESQKYFQRASYGLLGQAYLHTSWASYQNGDITQAWKQYRQSIDEKAWGKPVKVGK